MRFCAAHFSREGWTYIEASKSVGLSLSIASKSCEVVQLPIFASLFASGGKSHKCVAPTMEECAPRAKSISVLLGAREISLCCISSLYGAIRFAHWVVSVGVLVKYKQGIVAFYEVGKFRAKLKHELAERVVILYFNVKFYVPAPKAEVNVYYVGVLRYVQEKTVHFLFVK